MKKFYYISYVGQSRHGEHFGGQCIEVHPLAWMVMSAQMGDSNKVISWQEITEEEYNTYARKF